MKSNPSLPTLHPRTGLFSVCLVIAFLAVTGVLRWIAMTVENGQSSYPAEQAVPFFLVQLAFVGFLFGAVSGLIWAATRVENVWARYLLRTMVVVVGASLLNLAGTHDWMRNLSNTAGLALSQCTIFTILKVPSWRSSIADRTTEMPQRRQFLISDVIVATTCTAALLAIVQRYITPIADAEYWAVTILIFVVGPIIASCIHFAVLARDAGVRAVLAGLVVGLALLASCGLAVAQIATDPINLPLAYVTRFYLAFQVGYIIALAVFATAGRLEATSRWHRIG